MKKLELKQSQLFQMMWPITIELVVNGIFAIFNNLIFNQFSSNLLAVFGTASQIVVVVLNIYGLISVGTSIYFAQIIGAKQYDKCNKIINTALVLTIASGLFLSFFGVLFAPQLMEMINMPEELLGMGRQYLNIAIGFSVMNAILNIFTVIFRSMSRMISVMSTLITVNFIAFLLNASIFIFIPKEQQSVILYSWTGIIAQSIGVIIYVIILAKNKTFSFRFSIKEGISNSRTIIYRILRFGIPGGLEGIFFLIAQTVVVSFIGILGTTAMFTRAIVGSITYYMSLVSTTVCVAAGVIIGQEIGAGKIEEVKSSCKQNIKVSLGFTIPVCGFFMIFANKFLQIYTQDLDVLRVGMQVLLLACILETIRGIAGNYIAGLKAAGDVDYPFVLVILGGVLNIGISYYFGVYLKWGLPGIWIGYIADIVFRSIMSYLRWTGGKWMSYCSGGFIDD